GVGLRIDPRSEEALELGAAAVDHTQRCITGARELRGRLDQPLQECIERQLRGDRNAGLDERAHAGFVRADRAHTVSLLRYGGGAIGSRGAIDQARARAVEGGLKLDHVTGSVGYLEQAKRLYSQALAPLGYSLK